METADATQKFQELLREIFQFETSDLDFGIYRILNYKRKQIEKFINVDLINKVESAFEKHKSERLRDINQRFENAKQKVIQSLGQDAFTPTGELKKEFEATPVGREFLMLKEQKEEAETIDEIKLQVFNDLYNFFSRYYEEGDFIPQYRYSIKGHKYAIPYDGEEVKLYWTNYDQYYTKTGTLFRDYTFASEGYRIVFRIVSAKEELGSNKATKERLFILDDENPIEERDNELIIRFQYRELVEDEEILKIYEKRFKTTKENDKNSVESNRKGKQIKQDKLNQIIREQIINNIKDNTKKTILQKEYKKDSKGNSISLLDYHLNRFTAKNTKDYFIHKNLKRFLSEQLDYFIKSEVLDIENIEKEKFLDKHITRAKVVKEIGETIIDFLSQIEDFQKKLWEKKKFVIKTDYVITLDKIKEYSSEEFLESIIDEILKNEEQLKEWQELGFGEIKSKKDLILKDTLIEKEWKKLPIDTKYFSQEFKEKLLEKLTENHDLDDILDGLLIKSENWQALNLLLEKYKGKVQTIYIDPPFNKEQDADYLYSVKYKDSTWITMLENRLWLAKELLNERGSIFVRCDYNGNWIVRPLMDDIFGKENFRNEILINRKRQAIGTPNKFEIENESVFLYSKTDNYFRRDLYKPRSLANIKWSGFLKQEERHPQERRFFDKILYPPPGQHFSLNQEKVDKLLKENYLRLKCKECGAIYYYDDNNSRENFIDKIIQSKYKFKYMDITNNSLVFGVKSLDKCLVCGGDSWKVEYLTSEEEKITDNWKDIPSYEDSFSFKTENSEILLKRVIESTSGENDIVMDFFLGSGTTTAVAHKLKRKWIGVEMGEHFWTIVLPRMKKVLAYDKSGISKENDVREKYNEKSAGGFFMYQILEQYEDSLDNIELKENEMVQKLFEDEYLIKYFLNYETKESPYLLNIELLKNPFAYKLKVNLSEVGEPKEMIIDIPETFNYLLGLKVKKLKVRNNNSRKYMFILGEKESKNIAVVWREYDDNWNDSDFKEDKEFIMKELEPWMPHVVYINGQSILTPNFGNFTSEIQYIEPEFKRLMEV
jgi:adenine-specific DNA-methyltransferase